ncbi:Ctr86p [Sugiyamaella lignohabitans]|uniref:Ataxin-10 homolog n=1 Tax=Sugiyamaella lignohabitans TaxID=796027 RepID=A0A167E664_9ASCO|nr:Ctr86p [Sugiyamaella lignohabitans]ANB13691.1 Ctr86p [Sugiyamaella lignohabitans]
MCNEMTTSLKTEVLESPLEIVLKGSNTKFITAFKELLLHPVYSRPTLQFIESSVKLAPNRARVLAESEHGRLIFIQLLKQTESWYSGEDNFYLHLLNSIISQLLSADLGNLFLSTFSEPIVNEDERLSLLKIVDAAIDSLLERKSTTLDCQPLLEILFRDFTTASAQAIPFIRSADTSPEYSDSLLSQLTNIWNRLIVLLDIYQTILDNQPSLKPEILKDNIIEELVSLLGEAQKSLPRRSKLADLEKSASKSSSGNVSDHDDLDPKDFPLIKGKIIYLLGTLVQENKQVQDLVRQLQGLELVLTNCIIDLNNPFIRERSILCLRYLLANNPENQDFVAKMEAKETVSEDALHEAGYETELVNGKLALKKRT